MGIQFFHFIDTRFEICFDLFVVVAVENYPNAGVDSFVKTLIGLKAINYGFCLLNNILLPFQVMIRGGGGIVCGCRRVLSLIQNSSVHVFDQ